ncbi:sensor histidine kinase [Streptosporangium sp. NPDC051023]|uniref:sensor histidine kinase n=1 Tax=Streptosporangium sp. NPDC051023 TaxID=3155410 RepID=UPI003450B2EE
MSAGDVPSPGEPVSVAPGERPFSASDAEPQAVPVSGERHAYHRMNGWERLYLLDFVVSVAFAAFDDTLTPVWKVIVLLLLSGCAMAYVFLGRRIPGEAYGTTRGRVYIVLSIVLFTPASTLCPPTRFLLFAFGPQYYMLLPKRHAMIAAVALNLLPALYLPLLPREEDLIAFPIATVLSLASTLVFGPWIQDVVEQSRGRASLIEELERSRAEVARLSVERGVVTERERLAGEIHDTLAQGFTSIIMLLQQPDERRIELAVQTARENLAEARALVTALSPAPLSGATLEEALRRMVSRFGEELAVTAAFEVLGESRPTRTRAEVVLLRAAQEALANVRKHAGATAVTVTLEYVPLATRLAVLDDGVGFGPSAAEGYGLHGMRARVEQVGGSLSLTSPIGGGTLLEVVVPTHGSCSSPADVVPTHDPCPSPADVVPTREPGTPHADVVPARGPGDPPARRGV